MNKQAASSATSPTAVARPASRGDSTMATKRSQFDSVASEVVASPGPLSELPGVAQNEFGGVLVTPEQIRAAFQFLDVDKMNRVTADNLRARLGIFYDQLGMKDIKLLLHDQNELTEDYLTALLLTNEVKNFDPVAEAFKAYDPEETGYVARDMLRYVFERLGFGALTDEDLNVLVACADVDGDGRIGLADFRNLLQPTMDDTLSHNDDSHGVAIHGFIIVHIYCRPVAWGRRSVCFFLCSGPVSSTRGHVRSIRNPSFRRRVDVA